MIHVVLVAALLAAPSGKPRLAFLDLASGPDVTREVAQSAGELLVVALADTGKFDVITKTDVKALLGYEAQAQLLGCGEASCMMDLGGALGAAYLVSGSLGKLGGQLQLVLSLIDVNHTQVGRRVAQPVSSESSLPQALRDAVAKLTGEVVPESGPVDACSAPPCAKEAIAACRHWWAKEWDALTIVGVVPAGPYEQFLHEKTPARSFPLIVRTRARNGARSEYFASVRFKRVEGDWYFDEAGMRHLRELPIAPDDPPEEGALQKALSDGFAAAHPGSRVVKLAVDKYPDYERAEKETPASWSYRLDVTYTLAGKTQICPRAGARLVKAGKAWKYKTESDGNCEEVLDAAAGESQR